LLGQFNQSDVCRFPNDDPATGFVTGRTPGLWLCHG
jgi:hypothetical protein